MHCGNALCQLHRIAKHTLLTRENNTKKVNISCPGNSFSDHLDFWLRTDAFSVYVPLAICNDPGGECHEQIYFYAAYSIIITGTVEMQSSGT